jgi:hypothetical protein
MPSKTLDRLRQIANDNRRPDALQRLAMEAIAEIMTYREALYRAAPSHQGGHSETGAAISDALDCAFPLAFRDLEAKAKEERMDTKVLWPWLYAQRAAHRRS